MFSTGNVSSYSGFFNCELLFKLASEKKTGSSISIRFSGRKRSFSQEKSGITAKGNNFENILMPSF